MSARTPGPTEVEQEESRVSNADHDRRPAGYLQVPIGDQNGDCVVVADDGKHVLNGFDIGHLTETA